MYSVLVLSMILEGARGGRKGGLGGNGDDATLRAGGKVVQALTTHGVTRGVDQPLRFCFFEFCQILVKLSLPPSHDDCTPIGSFDLPSVE